MIDRGFIVPLSPPNSPRMSGYSLSPPDHEWQAVGRTLETTPPQSEGEMTILLAGAMEYGLNLDRKSFPYLLSDNNHVHHGVSDPPFRPDELVQPAMPTMVFDASIPDSPVSRLTPSTSYEGVDTRKIKDEMDEEALDEKDDLLIDDDDDEGKTSLSPSEIRAAKRKMKRFRLTHNQTRFLMSEFARQAHPDAGHRERLAREVPGLSPRQVQVWFQNRRAKLKRLTSDDRERMMRSRALPDDFDMTQALHSPFGNVARMTRPASYTPSFPETNMMRPLTIDTLRQAPHDNHASPTGISPAFSSIAFSSPQSAFSAALSPISPQKRPPFGFHSAPLDTSSRESNPFSPPVSSPSAFVAPHNVPCMPFPADHVVRSRSESLQSPLRTSMSYAHGNRNSSNGNNDSNDNDNNNSSSSSNDSSINTSNNHGSSNSNSNGNGNSNNDDDNDNVAGPAKSSNHADGPCPYSSSMVACEMNYSYPPVPGFQASHANRVRSYSSGIPGRMNLSISYTAGSKPAPQTAQCPPTYPTSPLGTSQAYALPQLSAPHHHSTFSHSFLRNDSTHPIQYSSVESVLGDVMGSDSHCEGNGLSSPY